MTDEKELDSPLRWSWLGRAPYREVWALMEAIRERVIAGDAGAERLLLCEHDPVLTLGRSARPEHVLDAAGVEVVRTSRGGDVTAHGPGQLVIYPVVRLPHGVLRYVEAVGGAIADELRARGVAGAAWRRHPAGVWVDDAKIAACGVHVKRRVAVHGFALNVTEAPLALFARIVPCGLAGTRTTSIASACAGRAPEVAELARAIAERVSRSLARAPQEIVRDASLGSCDREPLR